MNKSQRRFLGILILLALAGVGGYYAWRAYLAPGLPDGFASSNGRNEATEIDIASKIAGRVEEILVARATSSGAGQVLARMDTAVLEARLNEAEGELARGGFSSRLPRAWSDSARRRKLRPRR